MATGWQSTTLGELINVKHGYAFKSEFFAAEGEGVVLTPGNFPIGGGLRLRPGKDRYYTGQYPAEFELTPGDLLIVMTDLTQNAPILGSPAFVPSQPIMLHNQRLGLVTRRHGVDLDNRFLYYLLLSDASRSQLRATATGTTVRHTAPERIYRVVVEIPPLPVQRGIGAFLGAMDDLIENNRTRISILEQTVQLTYREWFLHFRFPGHERSSLVETDDGVAPDGWRTAAASSLLTINPRITLDRRRPHSFIAMADLEEGTMLCAPSQLRATGSGSKFGNGDTLFARITPCLQNGKTGFVQSLPEGEIGLGSTEFIVLRGRAVGPAYTYCLARSEAFRRHAIASMSGASGRQRVRGECFDTYMLAEPPPEVAERFEDFAEPLFRTIRTLAEQSKQLIALRDLLLPRLLTGQVNIPALRSDGSGS
jgi:type I restriction enzyme, S subunit